jgi:Domain of unknown function (DUF5666)
MPVPSSKAVSQITRISASQVENRASDEGLGKHHWPCSPTSFALALGAMVASILAGCGGAPMPPPGAPIAGQNTMVTVLMSSTANDQLLNFETAITEITLSDHAGTTVTLFNSPAGQPVEAIHLNGSSEPFVTVSVPQDFYTSATVTVGNCSFAEAYLPPGEELGTATFDQGTCAQGTGITTVNLASPIAVSGTAMTLTFDLQASQSFTLSGPIGNGSDTYTIDPVYNLTAGSIPSQPLDGLNGQISAINSGDSGSNGSAFSMQIPDGATVNVDANASTNFQGVSGLSALAAGTFVNMDGTIQTDGSLLATRIAVEDPTAQEIGVGPVGSVFATSAVFGEADVIYSLAIQDQGSYEFGLGLGFPYEYANTILHVSSGFTNLQNLPFTASFNASNMVAGQNLYTTSDTLLDTGGNATVAVTMTLMPQTIDGTVTEVSNSNGFAEYTVALAPYDLFPTFSAAPNQANSLSSASTVVVYADTNTRMETSAPFGAGSVVRFTGLIFNDNGTLRMDCSQINDGVAE